MRKTLAIIALCLPLITSVTASAATYEWIDGAGVVHFSDAPPAGQHYREMNLNVPPPTDADGVKDMNAFSRNYAKQQTAEDKAREAALKIKADHAQSCAKARHRISRLEAATAHRLFVKDAGGGRHRMTEPEFQNRLAHARARAKASCPG